VLEIVLADPVPGVRAGLRWLLRDAGDIVIRTEAGTIAEARAADGAVVVAGSGFPDGSTADLRGGGRPVVVYTFLPADERDVDLSGVAAVVRSGELRDRLADAIRMAVATHGSRPDGGDTTTPDSRRVTDAPRRARRRRL
jgi:DNA-binding NarL/FixJ family response regulator